jgi:putative membrane protein
MKTITTLRKLELFALTLSLAALPSLVRAAGHDSTPENRGQLSKSDYKFATEAATGGLMEVRAGELAREKASNPAVKQFGERMVADHGKANAELQKIAAQKGASLPSDLDDKGQRHLQHLQSLSGAEFDKAYIKAMVSDHKDDAKDFQKASQDVDDPDLKNFAAKTAPIIEQHLQQAKDLAANVEKNK